MTYEAEALTFAAEMARDGVLFDPTPGAIVGACMDFMKSSEPFSVRLTMGVQMSYSEVEGIGPAATEADITAAVRRTQGRYGLN